MKLLMWAIVLFGAFYSFGHAYYLFKGKSKIGAIAISIIGISIIVCPFFIRMK